MLSMYELYSYARRSRQREMFLEKEKLSSELNYLKAQINPHFLFNVLATVHALTIKKSPEAANVVVKLSELMRFMLFEVKNRKITVEEEINFLEGYIELEMVRFSNKLTVNFSKSIDNPGTKIEPLLLLPFVENAFKHGAAENRFHSFITIELKLLNDHLRFTVENATEPSVPDDYKISIGLDNVKRQLQMLYPGHKLNIEEREKSFTFNSTLTWEGMKKISCIIVEDEQLLVQVLEDHISKVPFLELKNSFNDGISALAWLEENSTNLIFIDINLPRLKGVDFIRMFPSGAKFIITSAYHEYAVEGYELNVVDYLLKPIEFNRFMMAVKKVADLETQPAQAFSKEEFAVKDFIFITVNKKRVKINFSEILYIEGMKEYVKIHLAKDRWLVTKLQIGQMEEVLSENFVRIHRSYIVSKKRVISYNHVESTVGNAVLPVGTNYKSSLSRLLET